MKKAFFILFLVVFSHLSAVVYLEPSPQFKPRVEISAVFIENEGRILLLHRQKDKHHENKWAIPGGKLDKNETPLQAAIREIQEETGYDISKNSVEHLKTVYVMHDEKNQFVYHMFRTQLQDDPGAVKINFGEHKGFTWASPEEALKMDLMQDEDPCFRLIYPL